MHINAHNSKRKCVFLGLFLVFTSFMQAQTRNELASIYTSPNGFSWANVGAAVNTNSFFASTTLSSSALKVVMGRFHLVRPADDYSWPWFPYAALRAYDGGQLAAGQPSLFVHAYYKGKTRPVVSCWSLGLQGTCSGTPTTPPDQWAYAVNVHDDRYINFWINQFVRPVLFQRLGALQNLWVGLDQCAFVPGLYGVLDDNNHFVTNVQWDVPYAQTQKDYYDSIHYFFTRVSQLAPDIRLMTNSGGLADWSEFQNTFGAAPGLMSEEINPYADASNAVYSPYTRNLFYDTMMAYSQASTGGQSDIFQSWVPSTNSSWILTSYAIYLLLKGPNTFYAPTIAGTALALPPSTYSGYGAKLGNPSGPLQSAQMANQPSNSVGYRLYSRQFAGGLLYLNYTGTPQVIDLPAGQTYTDVNGNAISRLVVNDLEAEIAYTNGSAANSNVPVATFTYASDVSTPGQYWVSFKLDRVAPKTATVNYHVVPPSGSAYGGTVVFAPGSQYVSTPLNVSRGVTTITIWGPSGAAIGTPYSFRLTAQ